MILGSDLIDFSPIWTWLLLTTRFAGILLVLPGIGTERIPMTMHFYAASVLAVALTISGIRAPEAASVGELVTMFGSELVLGYAMGLIPAIVLSGLSVAGQVISGAIGLGQANMIDRSLGGSVSIISQVQVLLATVIFLFLDGHHAVLRVAGGAVGELGIGLFRPDQHTAEILLQRLIDSFELAVLVAAPVLATSLLTQFVLGLVTKFVPQVNIFIISLPLGVLIGFFVIEATIPGLVNHVIAEFVKTEELVGSIGVINSP